MLAAKSVNMNVSYVIQLAAFLLIFCSGCSKSPEEIKEEAKQDAQNRIERIIKVEQLGDSALIKKNYASAKAAFAFLQEKLDTTWPDQRRKAAYADSMYSYEREQLYKHMERRPSQISKPKNVDDLFSDWDGSLPALKEYVKERLKNPDSFEHVETGWIEKQDYLLVQMKYRGTNGYGAVVTETIRARCDYSGNVISIE